MACHASPARQPDGRLELSIVDAGSGQPVAARLHLRTARGRAVPAKGWGAAPLGDHAYLDGPASLGLKRGAYRFDLDAGPEHRTRHGHFEITRRAEDQKRIEVERFADLASEGWLAADLATHRPAADVPLLHSAEQLAWTPTVTHELKEGAWAPIETAYRQRKLDGEPASAGALWSTPRGVAWLIDPTAGLTADDLPDPEQSSVALLHAAREAGWRVAATATSPELPLWVAHDAIDAVVTMDGWSDSDAGRAARANSIPRDELRFPGKDGPGRWRVYLYHQLVEAGVRLPPVGLSASGLNTAPIGSTRAYACVDRYADRKEDDLPNGAAWWAAAEGGATVVTNGPLLRPKVEGAPPGEVFLVEPGETRTFEIALRLATRDPIDYLEITKNGKTLHSVRLAEFAEARGRLPVVTFDASGWFAVEAVAAANDRYRAAVSAPYFVESPAGPRVGCRASQFWCDQLAAAAERFAAEQPDAYAAATRFWRAKLVGAVE